MGDVGLSREQSLAGIPMFAAVEEEVGRAATPLDSGPWADLAERATPHRVTAGDWLWHRGDAGDSLYVILTGRLEVVVEEPEQRVIRVVGRGDAVGELALLTEQPRSAGVRAARDSELLRMAREDFLEVLDSRPEFARALTRVLGRQLRDANMATIETDPIPSTIAVVPLERGLPVADIGGYLALQLGRWRSIVTLDGRDAAGDGDDGAFGRMLDRAERDVKQVLLLANDPDPESAWTAFCLRQADRVVALSGSNGARPHPRHRGCDLFVLERTDAASLARLVAELDPRNVQVIDDGHAAPLERAARRLAGRAVGLVLSGGGARAFAHVGVLEELERAGVEVDRVGGTSGGAWVGSQYAAGRTPAEIFEACRREFVEDNPLNDYTLPLVSITRNRKGIRMLDRCLGDVHFEELEREFFCISADMQTAEKVVHRRGPVAPAVAASMTLPGVLPPFTHEGRLLLDGGVLNNLPVDVMGATGEGPVVAVDVSHRFELSGDERSRFRRPRLARLADRAREWIVGSSANLPSFGETITRAIALGSMDTAKAAQRFADVVIVPDVAEFGLLDWDHLDEMVDAGRRAAREALAVAPAGLLVTT